MDIITVNQWTKKKCNECLPHALNLIRMMKTDLHHMIELVIKIQMSKWMERYLHSIVHHQKFSFQIHLFPCRHQTFYLQPQQLKDLDSYSAWQMIKFVHMKKWKNKKSGLYGREQENLVPSMCSLQICHHICQRKVCSFHSVDLAI